MTFNKGTEERGCTFRVKKARIYVHLQLQRNTGSTRVVNTRPCIFQISVRQKIFWEIFGMVEQYMDDKRSARLTYRCRWTWRCRPLMIHVRVCAQASSATKTQGNLVCPVFSKPPTDEGTKTLIFILSYMQKRCLHTHASWDPWPLLHTCQTHEQEPPNRCFCFLEVSAQVYFRALWRI
jgi:hypothetical protein